jgi:hypothetical protein
VTPEQVGKIVKRLLASWPTQAARIDNKAEMTLAYGAGLMDLEYDAASKALNELAKLEVFIPAIATIRARAVSEAHGERRSGVQAWGDVTAEVRRVGHTKAPVFEDSFTAAAVRDLGWAAICESKMADASVRARFIELYDHLATREYRAAQVAPGAKSRSLPVRNGEPKALDGLLKGYLPASKTEDDNDE